MSFDRISDYEYFQDPAFFYNSSDFNIQNDHVYGGGATVQSAAGCVSGTFPLGDARFFESENQSAQSRSSPCDASGSIMSGQQLPNGQGYYGINDNRNKDGTEIHHDFEVPIDPAISQAERQGYSYALPTAPASHQLGDHQQIMHHRRLSTQDYRYSPGFYIWDGLPYHCDGHNFRLLTDQEMISHQVFHSVGGMGPPQMHMPPTAIRRTHANMERPAGLYGPSTALSREAAFHTPRLIKTLPPRFWAPPHDTFAASTSAQGVMHNEYRQFTTATQGDGQAVQSTYAVPRHGAPLPRHHHLPPSLPAGSPPVPSFSGFLPVVTPRDVELDVFPAPSSQIVDDVDPLQLNSQTEALVAGAGSTSHISTRQRPKKRKQPTLEDHLRTCGWSGTCTAKVHPNDLRDHLRVHLEHVDGDRAPCGYLGCNKTMQKEGLARHYLTHFGARAECCECERSFARPDEITRGHKTKDRINCPSKRWRRFITDDNGSRNYF